MDISKVKVGTQKRIFWKKRKACPVTRALSLSPDLGGEGGVRGG
jgi:hypothetical protein